MPAAARGRRRPPSDVGVKMRPPAGEDMPVPPLQRDIAIMESVLANEDSEAEDTEVDRERRASSPSSIGKASSSETSEEVQLPRPFLMALRTYAMTLRRSPSEGAIMLADHYVRQGMTARMFQSLSLPVRFEDWAPVPRPPRPDEGSRRPRLSRSQARLIIPRSISEYLECCRGARAHSEGLLLAFTEPEGALEGCRNIVPTALSEGLLGGRIVPPRRRAPSEGEGEERQPPPRIPAEKVEPGMRMEGRIVRNCRIGVFIDVGATRCGLLPFKACRYIPRWMLQKGESLSNLVVTHVNKKKRQFTMAIQGVGADGEEVEEVKYSEILHRIADWAGVEVPEGQDKKDGGDKLSSAATNGAKVSSPKGANGAKADGTRGARLASQPKGAEPHSGRGAGRGAPPGLEAAAAPRAAEGDADLEEAAALGAAGKKRRHPRNRGGQKAAGKGK